MLEFHGKVGERWLFGKCADVQHEEDQHVYPLLEGYFPVELQTAGVHQRLSMWVMINYIAISKSNSNDRPSFNIGVIYPFQDEM